MAKYQEIAQEIKSAIDRREIRPGAKVPSATELRKQYGISHITAMNVYQRLAESDYIENFAGRGYYVKKVDELRHTVRSCQLGLCIRSLWDYNLSDVYFNEITFGVQQECVRHRYSWQQHFSSQILNQWPFNHGNAAEIKQGFASMADKVDGFLVDPHVPDDVLAEIMRDVKRPMVLLNRTTKLDGIDMAVPPVAEELTMALELALRLAYRNFLLVIDEKYQEYALFDTVRKTFDRFMAEHGVEPGRVTVIPGCNVAPHDRTLALVEETLAAMPDGKSLVVSSIAATIWRATRTMAAPPGILSVLDTWANRDPDMALTSLQLKPVEVGKLAVRTLLERILGSGTPFGVVSPKAELVIGKTL